MPRHDEHTIAIQFAGDCEDLRLDDFLDEMQKVKAALRETERFVSGREPSLYLRIKGLHKSSPAKVILEAVSEADDDRADPRYASYVVRTLATNLRIISKKRRLPTKIDVPVLDSYREMTAPIERHKLDVEIRVGNNAILINKRFREILDSIAGEDEFSYGSVSGKIEAINLHERNRRFIIFPVIGPSRVVGTFRSRDRKRFAEAVDRYVTVYGRLRYKTWDKFPYAINADSITVHDAASPGLDALRGIAPDATGGLSSQEFVDRLNDEW